MIHKTGKDHNIVSSNGKNYLLLFELNLNASIKSRPGKSSVFCVTAGKTCKNHILSYDIYKPFAHRTGGLDPLVNPQCLPLPFVFSFCVFVHGMGICAFVFTCVSM